LVDEIILYLKCSIRGWFSPHLNNRFTASSQMIFRERQDLQLIFNCYILTANLSSSYCPYLSQFLRTITPSYHHTCA